MRMIMTALAAWLALAFTGTAAQAGPTARLLDSGEGLELISQPDGQTVREVIPVHRAGNVRYFSAGVGLDERTAEYPAFALKLVFTAGGKPYLSGVAVVIESGPKGETVSIPAEHVAGPWLFLDLPPGTYRVTGTYGTESRSVKGITIEAGKRRVVHLRWPEDRGFVGRLQEE